MTFDFRKSVLLSAKFALALVLLVMLAGSVVRMTGSGMGCPDWPKCFGYFIPPTDIDQLIWKPEIEYFKGQMIIKDDELLVAKDRFVSSTDFVSAHWAPYDKHDYAIFNPFHTWTEYINRLLGALSGIPVLVLFLLSAINVRRDFVTFLLAALTLATLGFVAWLGKLIVDGNLIPHSITYHMFGALALVFLLIGVLHRNMKTSDSLKLNHSRLHILGVFVVLLTIAQIFMGTNVREEVDHISGAFQRSEWVQQLGTLFYVHRSFSIIIVVLNLWWVSRLLREGMPKKWPLFLITLIGVEIFAGVLMNYFGFPAWAQPIHLLSATMIVGIQFYLTLLLWFPARRSIVTS